MLLLDNETSEMLNDYLRGLAASAEGSVWIGCRATGVYTVDRADGADWIVIATYSMEKPVAATQ